MDARLVVVILAALSAGPAQAAWLAAPADAADAGRTVVDDPAGDAREFHAADVAASTGRCSRLREVCEAVPPAGGAPAPPDRDILAVEMADTPETLTVALVVAALDDQAMGEAAEGGWVDYRVCWETGSGECVIAFTYTVGEGPNLEQEFSFSSPECALSAVCDWAVPARRETGSPGRIVWDVPRWLLPNGSRSTTFDNVAASTAVFFRPTQGAAGSTPLDEAAGDVALRGDNFDADRTDVGTYTLVTEAAPPPPPPAPVLLQDNVGDILGTAAPGDEVLAATWVETPETLTYALQLDVVAEEPPMQLLDGEFHLPRMRQVDLVLETVDGERVASAGTCADVADDGACVRYVSLPVDLAVAAGAPGWLNLTFDRADLAFPRRGESIAYSLSVLRRVERHDAPTLEAPASVVRFLAEDWASPLPYFALAHDTAAVAAQEFPGTLIEDAQGDVRAPNAAFGLDPGERRRYDILGVVAEGVSPTESKITLAVQDLSRVRVPTGFDAVFYAAAVEVDGAQVMVGYLKDDARQEFFCAQDTAVLVGGKSDPREVVWTTILGVLSTGAGGGGRGAGGGAGGASSITFFVPHTCFGKEEPGEVLVDRIAAGSYLVQDPTGANPQVFALDEVESDAPLTLGALATVPTPLPWYAAPFGIAEFWNIFGVAAAVVTSGVGAALVQRRRAVLRRYLREVEEAERAHLEDPAARTAALKALRARLKADLVRSRISEAHYVVVERRIDEELSQARVDAMAKTLERIEARLGVVRDLPEDMP